MATVSLAVFTFKIRKFDSSRHSDYCELDNMNGENLKFKDLLFEFVKNNIENYSNDCDKKEIFKISYAEDGKKENYDSVFCEVESGNYGEESYLVDVLTMEKSKKASNIAEVKPMNFGILYDKSSEDVTKGFIIFQNHGIYGIKTTVEKYLNDFLTDYFRASEDAYRIELFNAVPTDYFKNLLASGKLSQIQLSSYCYKKDLTNELDKKLPKYFRKETRIYSKIDDVDKVASKLLNFINKKCELTDIIEIGDFKYDDVAFKIRNGGAERKIYINNNKSKFLIPLGNEIVQNGVINKNLLYKEMCKIYEEYSGHVIMNEKEGS